MAEESTVVGSITGELKLDISQWVRAIDEAEAKAKGLEGTRPVFEIDAENRKALEAIDEVEASAEELEAKPARVGVEVDSARADAKLEETRAEAAKPIVQHVEIRTEGAVVVPAAESPVLAPTPAVDATVAHVDVEVDTARAEANLDALRVDAAKPIVQVVEIRTETAPVLPADDGPAFVPGTLRPAAMGETSSTGMMAAEQLAGANGDLVASYRAVETASVSVSEALTEEQAKALDTAVAKIQAANAEKAATAAERAYVDVLADERASADAIAQAEAKAVEARQAAGRAASELTTVLRETSDAEDDLGRKTEDAADTGKRAAADWRGPLIGGLVALSSAAPPVAAGLLAITAGATGMGAAGVLAFLGIRAAMTQNTTEGQAYRGLIADLKGDLSGLADTASLGLLPGVQAGVEELDEHLPALRSETRGFAEELSAIVPTGVDAVATAVERAEPLLDDGAAAVQSFVRGLDSGAHSEGFQSFLDYLIATLPQAEQFLSDAGHTAGDFLHDWSEVGGPALTVVDGLVNGLDAILKVTGPLIPASIALFGAWRAAAAIGGVMGAGLDIAKTAMVELGLAADTTTGELAATAIAEDVASDGVNLIPQAAAAAGGAALLGGVGLAGAFAGSSSKPQQPTTPAAVPTSKAAESGLYAGDESYNGFGASAPQAATAIDGVTAAEKRSSATSVQLAASVQSAVTQMLALAKSGQTLESTADAVGDAEDALSKAIRTNGTSLDQNTAAGRANREATLAVSQAVVEHANAIDSDGKHALQAKAYVLEHAKSLEDQMVAAGMDRKAVDELVGSLLDVSKVKPVTKVDVQTAQADAAIASIKAHMDQLNGTAASVYVNLVANGISTGRASQIAKNAGMADGGTAGIPGAADGVTAGTITGPGNAAADMAGVYRLANGEEVTSNKFGQASAFRPVLKAIGSQQVRTMDDLAAMLGGRRGNVSTKAVHVGGVHFHNPVAEDPVASAEQASQLIGTYAATL